MKLQKALWPFLCMFVLQSQLRAQEKVNIKFGKVTAADFSPKSPAIDSSSNAVVLADIGSTEFEGNTKGYFTLIFKQHERILLKSRNAFDEATVRVTLYNGNYEYE